MYEVNLTKNNPKIHNTEDVERILRYINVGEFGEATIN